MSNVTYWQQQANTKQRLINRLSKQVNEHELTILTLRSRLIELEAKLGIHPFGAHK